MTWYLDTSAALKLVIEEPESAALAGALDAGEERLVSSMLLFTELHCAAQRRTLIEPAAVNAVLDAVDLVDLERDDLVRAGTSAWGLRSADAIHLAVALRIGATDLVAYDQDLCRLAVRAGLGVVQPS